MKEKSYLLVSSLLFAAMAILHLIRLVNSWEVTINNWGMPNWLSGVAIVILGFLVVSGIRLYKK